MATYFVFINFFLNIAFNKKLKLKIVSAASSGGQEKLTYFIYFLSPPREAGLLISSRFLLIVLEVTVSYLHVLDDPSSPK
jgi:hypothetical protein